MLGTVDHGASHGTAHAGAVYLHQGESYLVLDLDLEESVATVVPAPEVDYSTSAREITDIEIVREARHETWDRVRLSFGTVRVTHQVVSYLKRKVPSGEVIGEEPLDLPERTLETASVWWTVPDDVLEDAGIDKLDLPGAAHAAEHASIGLLPLFATCDRWDIGGVSTARHADTGMLTVFVYDGHPGGAGLLRTRLRHRRSSGWKPPAKPSTPAHAPKAARRACSHRSAATRTTRSTRPEQSGCSTWCSPGPTVVEVRVP